MVCVSWNEAVECCEQLNGLLADNLQSGWHFSLPLGVQWEFAARGGVKSRGYKYSGSDNIGEVAWYDENAEGRTHEVGLLQPNELGIYDMSGNVLEWCHDWYGEFPLMSLMDPGPSYIGDPSREFRGGSYHHVAKDCTVTYRESCGISWSSLYIGFRVALVPIV